MYCVLLYVHIWSLHIHTISLSHVVPQHVNAYCACYAIYSPTSSSHHSRTPSFYRPYSLLESIRGCCYSIYFLHPSLFLCLALTTHSHLCIAHLLPSRRLRSGTTHRSDRELERNIHLQRSKGRLAARIMVSIPNSQMLLARRSWRLREELLPRYPSLVLFAFTRSLRYYATLMIIHHA